MKVYSPSQTKAYIESPLGWYLHYVEGWSPKMIGRKELSGFLGSAFATGMDLWWKSPRGAGTQEAQLQLVCSETIIEKSQQALAHDLQRACNLGHVVSSKEEPFLLNLPSHLAKALEKGLRHSPIPQEWKVLGSEVRIEEAGNCRLDLLVDTPQGVTFVDYKTKVTLEGYAKDRAITDWSQDWQFYHYAWALAKYRHKPVTSFSVALVVCSGTVKPSLHTFPLDQELLQMWEISAQQCWADMEKIEAGERIPTWGFQMSNRFGPDSWAEAIVNCKLHENLMSRNYIRKEVRH